jgi:hypothetical protein
MCDGVLGTDDEKFATDTAGDEDSIVIDAATGDWIGCDGNKLPVYDAQDPDRP